MDPLSKEYKFDPGRIKFLDQSPPEDDNDVIFDSPDSQMKLVAHILYHKFKQGMGWQELIRLYETQWKQFFVSKHGKIEDMNDIKQYIHNKFRAEP